MASTPTVLDYATASKIGEEVNLDKIRTMVKSMASQESTDGVLAVDVDIVKTRDGKPVFLLHLRTTDEASLERVLSAARDEYKGRFVAEQAEGATPQNAFKDTWHVKWETQLYGASVEAKFPAIRISFVHFKKETSPEAIAKFKEVVKSLPAKFPLLKQVSFGKNISPQIGNEPRWDVGVYFGFTSTQARIDMDDDPEFVKIRPHLHNVIDHTFSKSFELCYDA